MFPPHARTPGPGEFPRVSGSDLLLSDAHPRPLRLPEAGRGRRAWAALPVGRAAGVQGVEEGLARAPCSSRPISSLLGSWGRMEHMGRRGAGTGEEGTRRAAPGAGEHRLGRQQLPGVDLVDHSGLGVSAEASFTPLCIRPLHTACWGPGRFRLQAPDPRLGPCYRPHVPAPGASLWAGPASMGEDGGCSTEPPPAAASTGPVGQPWPR